MIKRAQESIGSFFNQSAITMELIVCLRQLAVMYTAGIPFARAMHIISEQATQVKLKHAFAVSRRRIEAGSAIASSFAEFPDIFPELYMRLLEVGENTGKLEHILDSIALHAEKAQKSAMKLRTALVYPVFVLVMCLAFLILGPAYLFRGLYDFLKGLNIPLPLPTRFLVDASSFMRTPVFPVAVVVAIFLMISFVRWIWRQVYWRHYIQNIILAIPGIGPFYQSAQVTIFARTLAIVYESGMPLIQGLELVKKSVGLLRFQYELDNVIEQVIEGDSLQESLARSNFFPPVLLQFVKAGEESGDLGRMLNWSAWICEQNNDHILDIVMEAIQPFVLLIIGTLVGFMIIATMAPMLSVIQQIS